MKFVLLVGIGGFLGSSSRYLLQKSLTEIFITSFPAPIFIINILGSFIIGLLFGISNKYEILSPEVRILLTTGFCGGFTTFSTFSNDGLTLLKDGNILYFFLYIFLSVFLGLIFTYLGYQLIKIL